MKIPKLLPIIMELVGIVAIGGGIGIELALKADLGYLLITGGSCVVAIGAVIWGKFVRIHRGVKQYDRESKT